MKTAWASAPKSCYIGVICGRFRTDDGKTFSMLRDELGRERCFSDAGLRQVPRAEVLALNHAFEEMRLPDRVPMTPEPIRHAGTDAFTPHIWCHKCGTGRLGLGKCPKGCQEKPLAEDMPLDAPLGQEDK